MRLSNLLKPLVPEEPLWLSATASLTAAAIEHQLQIYRSQITGQRLERVVLESNTSFEALIWLLALDGLVQQVFLVPPSLRASSDYAELKTSFNPTWVIDEASFQLKADNNFPTKPQKSTAPLLTTRWLLATSGTTGTPKLVEHTSSSLTKSCKFNSNRGQEFIWGLVYEPFRFAGLQVVLQTLASGSQLVLIDTTADIEEQAATISTAAVNALSATPTYWRKLLISGKLKKHPFKQITLGGEAADQTLLNALKQAYPLARVTHIYASTEAGVGFSVNDGLAGFPQEFLTSGVGGNQLAISPTSTLLIQSKLAAKKEYLDTGDLVESKDQRIYFLGRDSGAINVGGNKVIPEEVETVIRQLEGVAEVLVKPLKSGVMGQLVLAEVELTPIVTDPAAFKKDITQHCIAQLEKYKVPAIIKFVEQVTFNPSGKVNRS